MFFIAKSVARCKQCDCIPAYLEMSWFISFCAATSASVCENTALPCASAGAFASLHRLLLHAPLLPRCHLHALSSIAFYSEHQFAGRVHDECQSLIMLVSPEPKCYLPSIGQTGLLLLFLGVNWSKWWLFGYQQSPSVNFLRTFWHVF